MENVRCLDETVDYKLVELGIFGSYDNSSDSSSYSDLVLPYYFPRQTVLQKA